jgi:hypothetical protein
MERAHSIRPWWTLGLPPERWLEILLGLLLFFVFIGRPLVGEFPQTDAVVEVVLTLVLASGVAATTHRGGLTIAILAAITIAVGWIAWGTQVTWLRVLHNGVAILYCAALTAYVLGEVFRPNEVRRHQIEGAIAAYLLIGVAWSFAYNTVFLLRHDAFAFGNPMVANDPESEGRFLYFSFVTLTTMGYGDITPTIATTEMMAVLEALVGQLFPSILLARLVSMELHHRLLREAGATRRDG